MMKILTPEEIADILRQKDNIQIFMHRSPDGDTIGCAYALCMALQRLGKNVRAVCSDEIHKKYSYITDKVKKQDFTPGFFISVDIASTQLLGEQYKDYYDKIDLLIDHHGSNTGFAKCGYVDSTSAACTEIVAEVIRKMGVSIDRDIANAIFTGICTDTGCFKYSNVTAKTHIDAADMISCGADSAYICRLMFDTKSKSRIDIERMALESLEFYEDNKIALICITKQMIDASGADESDTEGIAALPRQVEGALIGITIREKENGEFKISARSAGDINVSKMCSLFGGGGHIAAAGCSIHGTVDYAKEQIVSAAVATLKEYPEEQ